MKKTCYCEQALQPRSKVMLAEPECAFATHPLLINTLEKGFGMLLDCRRCITITRVETNEDCDTTEHGGHEFTKDLPLEQSVWLHSLCSDVSDNLLSKQSQGHFLL